MSLRIFTIGALSVLTAVVAVSAIGPPQPVLRRPNSPGPAMVHVAASRSLQQQASPTASKFDASLAEIARHSDTIRPDHAIEDLHAVNPAAKFAQPSDSPAPLVLIDAITRGNP